MNEEQYVSHSAAPELVCGSLELELPPCVTPPPAPIWTKRRSVAGQVTYSSYDVPGTVVLQYCRFQVRMERV